MNHLIIHQAKALAVKLPSTPTEQNAKTEANNKAIALEK